MNIQRVMEKKVNDKYVVTDVNTDVAYVYQSLANDLVNKKLRSCNYIRAISYFMFFPILH